MPPFVHSRVRRRAPYMTSVSTRNSANDAVARKPRASVKYRKRTASSVAASATRRGRSAKPVPSGPLLQNGTPVRSSSWPAVARRNVAILSIITSHAASSRATPSCSTSVDARWICISVAAVPMDISTLSMRAMTCAGARESRASPRARVQTSRSFVSRCCASSMPVARWASTLTCPDRTARVICHCSVSPSSVAAGGSPSS